MKNEAIWFQWTRFSKQLSIFWVHSKRCMWGQQWALHKSDCISVISMVQSVLTVAWPETHTVPGMGSPAPDTTLLEFTPRGNSTHTITADVWGWCQMSTPPPVDFLALKVTSLWRLLPSDYSRHMAGRGYVKPISVCTRSPSSSFIFFFILPPISLTFFQFTHLLCFHHMFRLIPSHLLSAVDDSDGKMFAMATPHSCAMGCKLMVSVLNDCEKCICNGVWANVGLSKNTVG